MFSHAIVHICVIIFCVWDMWMTEINVQTMLSVQRCHLYVHMHHWHWIDFEVHEIKKAYGTKVHQNDVGLANGVVVECSKLENI